MVFSEILCGESFETYEELEQHIEIGDHGQFLPEKLNAVDTALQKYCERVGTMISECSLPTASDQSNVEQTLEL